MLFKLSLLYACIFFFYFIGQVFTNYAKKISNLSPKLLTASESIFLGIFIFGSYIFIFNFFYKINSYEFLFTSIFFVILILFKFKDYRLNKKQFKNILIFSLISFPITLSMVPGYDAGLYHVAHQQFIREEKIVFGLAQLHYGFGFSSFYEYLSAPLWFQNNLNNLPNIQLIFYIALFLFIYEISKIDKEKSTYGLLALFTIPFWFRYAEIKWGLVDFPFGVVFFLSVFISIILLKSKNEKKTKHLFNFFVILNCLTFFLKPGGFVIGLLTIFVSYILLKKNIYNLKTLIKILFFPFTIIFLWLVRGFISTSCLIYPFSFTCLDTSWGNSSEANLNWIKIQDWGQIIFEIVKNNMTFSNEFIIVIFLVFLICLILLHNKFIKLNLNVKIKNFYYILTILFITQLIIFNIGTDFSRNQISYNKIIIEILYLIIIFVIYYLIIFLSFGLKPINKEIFNLNLFPLLFSTLVIILWLISAPIPRLGYSFIGSFFISFLFFIKKGFPLIVSQKKNIFLIKLYLILITLNFNFFSDLNYKKLNYDNISVPQINTVNRLGFGIKPTDGDQCWDKLWCSPLEPYPLNLKEIKGYLFLTKK